MQLPAPLLRNKKDAHKNDFGHVLILAGSPSMLGAAALVSLAAMRSGAGLVTLAVPKSLNITAQKKISNVIMTWPLDETKEHTFSAKAFTKIKKKFHKFDAIAIGPGMTDHPQTKKFILKVIESTDVPIVIDADALNCLSDHLGVLTKNKNPKILTPHVGEMSRLTNLPKNTIEGNRIKTAKNFAKKYNCVLLLKGRHTVVSSPKGDIYINKTGNPGMATAGSGDVLTGMITAFLGQGLNSFEAAKYAAYYHGKAGDIAVKSKNQVSLIASDIIENIPKALK